LAFRFLHTADLHLDSPLRSLALRDPALRDVVGVATRRALTRIVDLCLSEAVDALLIAGDLYDGDQVSMKTARFLAQELQRLDKAGIATFIIRGNHDALSRITRELVLPASVKVFGARPETVRLDRGGLAVAIHGLSFAKPQAPDSLLGQYPAPVPGAFNIGLMHTSLNGSPGHDIYAPCSAADLQAAGYDYWALGHIHLRQVIEGRTAIVMPGIPQGRDIGEAGETSVTLVTVTDQRAVLLDARPVAEVQFDRVTVALDGATEWGDLARRLEQAVAVARRRIAADVAVLRLVLTGRTPLAWRVTRDLDLLHEQAVAAGETLGTVWIDKLENRSDGGLAEAALPPDLSAMILQGLPADPGVLAAADREIDDLVKALPKELRGMLGQDAAAQSTARDALLADGIAQVLARLAPAEVE
jgi:DNA repair exonuclease SbcCD nuclease subunit